MPIPLPTSIKYTYICATYSMLNPAFCRTTQNSVKRIAIFVIMFHYFSDFSRYPQIGIC